MSRPQLFQHIEPNISGVVTMVTFQKQDLLLVLARQNSLEMEISQISADGERTKYLLILQKVFGLAESVRPRPVVSLQLKRQIDPALLTQITSPGF
jgi:hypothetical protein